ncbi:unnamed protein product [Lampetra fluviatilis]
MDFPKVASRSGCGERLTNPQNGDVARVRRGLRRRRTAPALLLSPDLATIHLPPPTTAGGLDKKKPAARDSSHAAIRHLVVPGLKPLALPSSPSTSDGFHRSCRRRLNPPPPSPVVVVFVTNTRAAGPLLACHARPPRGALLFHVREDEG